MPTLHGESREWSPEETAVVEAVEGVLAIYRRSPIALLTKERRRGLAIQCAVAAMQAMGRGFPHEET